MSEENEAPFGDRLRASAAPCSLHGPVTYNLNAALLRNADSPSRGQNNQFFPLRVTRRLAPEALKTALMEVTQMHPSLRSSFHCIGGTFVQSIHEDWREHFSYDYQQYDRDIPQAAIMNAIEDLHRRSFSPEKPCAFSVIALHGVHETLILAYLSHNITDAWGMRIIADGLADRLDSGATIEVLPAIHHPGNPIEVAKYEACYLADLDPQIVRDQCASLTPTLTSRSRSEGPVGGVVPKQYRISWATWNVLKQRAIAEFGSVEVFLLAKVASHDMAVHDAASTIVNVLDANRPTAEHRRTIMDLANIIPVPVNRSDLSSREALGALCSRIRMLRQQAVPFWRLCAELGGDAISPRYGASPLTVSVYPVGSRRDRYKDFVLASELMRPPGYPYFDLILHSGPFFKNSDIPITMFLHDKSPHHQHADSLFDKIQHLDATITR